VICGNVYPMLLNMSAVYLKTVGNKPNHSTAPPAALHATLVTRISFNQKNRSHSSVVRWKQLCNGHRDRVGYGTRMWWHCGRRRYTGGGVGWSLYKNMPSKWPDIEMVLVTTRTHYNTDWSESRIPDFVKATILLKNHKNLTNSGRATIQYG